MKQQVKQKGLYRGSDLGREFAAPADLPDTVCLGAGIFDRHFALAGIFGYNRQGGRHDVATYKFV
jgi:hypothetical protein